MSSMVQWPDDEGAAPRRQRRGQVLGVACLLLCGYVGRASASELVIGRAALQTLVVSSVFKVSATNLAIGNVTMLADGVAIEFEIKLSAR